MSRPCSSCHRDIHPADPGPHCDWCAEDEADEADEAAHEAWSAELDAEA